MSEENLLQRALALPGLAVLDGVEGVHLVGGAVRDLLLGIDPQDIDLAVEGGLARIGPLLGVEPAEIASYERFGTATTRLGGRRLDLAVTRAESYPRPGALPEVRAAGIDEDLARRDFTVNALALQLGGADAGRLREAPGARDDLEHTRLRVLHERSFEDDPTRLLRLARYAGRLGFHPEEETARLAEEAVATGALDAVSGHRLGAELRQLAAEPKPLQTFSVLGSLGIDAGVERDFGLDADLAARALGLVPPDGRPGVVVMAVACLRLAQPAALLDRLGFTAAERQGILLALAAPRDLAGHHPGEVAERLQTPEQAAMAGALGAEEEAREWIERSRLVRLRIGGDDLLAAGVRRGPAIGEILREVLRGLIAGDVRGGREPELAAALAVAARLGAI